MTCFAVLPYVSVPPRLPLLLGPFVLWRNEASEWVARMGADNTKFLEMYRTSQGEAVGPNASILTKGNGNDASPEEFRDAVYCLSTAAWLRDQVASDAWVFERWIGTLPMSTKNLYCRASKFTSNYTAADFDRVYPTPYMYRIDLSHADQDAINWLAPELSKPRSSSIVTALGHFHLARFDTPYFTSIGDSIEAMWSGLESLLSIDQYGAGEPNASKGNKLRHALLHELGPHVGSEPVLWEVLDAWTSRFYQERNHHSHGARVELKATPTELHGISAYEISLNVVRAILELRWRGDNFFHRGRIADNFASLFAIAPLVERIASALNGRDRKCWHPGTGKYQAQVTDNDVDNLARDLKLFVNIRRQTLRFVKNSRVGQARQKMGLVLSAWVSSLQGSKPPHVNLSPVADVPAKISQLLAANMSPEDIDDEISYMLANSDAHDQESYGASDAEPALNLRGKIPIWLWAGAHIKLTELWLGHAVQ
ncbi:MAG TPA: hypothetical protein VFS43_27855 [Polyangiaceae bacterium]|nr:hypothetical protein [Polyangiaceae bacterium]